MLLVVDKVLGVEHEHCLIPLVMKFGAIPTDLAQGMLDMEPEPFEEDQISQMKMAFDRFDVDGNGTLDIHEIEHCLGQLGLTNDSDTVKSLMSEIDLDGKLEEISFDEFIHLMMIAAKMRHINAGKPLSKFSYRTFALGSFSSADRDPATQRDIERLHEHVSKQLNDLQATIGALAQAIGTTLPSKDSH